jgi:hypothetical protein
VKQRIDELGSGCFGVMLCCIVLPSMLIGGLGTYWLLS